MAKTNEQYQHAADEIVRVIDNTEPLYLRKIAIFKKHHKCFAQPMTGNGCAARFGPLVGEAANEAASASDDRAWARTLRSATARRLAMAQLRDEVRAMIKSGEWAKYHGGVAGLAGAIPKRGTKRAKIAPGYAFAATGANWREIPDDDWNNVMVPSHKIDEPGYFRLVGRRKIDGSDCFIWEQRKEKHGADRVFWAQTTAHHGRAGLRGAPTAKRSGRTVSGLRGWRW